MSSTKIEENQGPERDQEAPEGTMSVDGSVAGDSASIASGRTSRSSGSARSVLSEKIMQERDEDLAKEQERMDIKRACSNADIASLQRQLMDAIQQSQVQETLYQAKKDNIWQCA